MVTSSRPGRNAPSIPTSTTLPLLPPSGRLSPLRQACAFTLIELVVVITVLGVALSLLGLRTGGFSFWNEEAFIRRLSETITFLHYQAVAERATYQLELDLKANSYRVGIAREEGDLNENLTELAADAGNISLELAAFLNPSTGAGYTLIPPPSFPSLAEPVPLPKGSIIEDVRTMRGFFTASEEGGKARIFFSPRGFSEFAVIHIKLESSGVRTILVNPFTGTTDIFRDRRDFEWTYGRKKKGSGT